MATAAEVAEVRENTNEPTEETYSDSYVEALVDSGTVASASAVIWTRKAAVYAELVDTSEAGASLKLSDLHKNALTMATKFGAEAGVVVASGVGRAKVHKIVRD